MIATRHDGTKGYIPDYLTRAGQPKKLQGLLTSQLMALEFYGFLPDPGKLITSVTMEIMQHLDKTA
jgi:hypothetical protein